MRTSESLTVKSAAETAEEKQELLHGTRFLYSSRIRSFEDPENALITQIKD